MIEQVTLRDGTDAFVVPLERTDRAALVAEFETLSPQVPAPAVPRAGHAPQRRDAGPPRSTTSTASTTSATRPRAVRRDEPGRRRRPSYWRGWCATTTPPTPPTSPFSPSRTTWQGRGVATVLLEVLMRPATGGRATASSPRCCRTTRRPWACSAASARVSLEDDGHGLYGVVVELERSSPAVRDAGRAAGRRSVAGARGDVGDEQADGPCCTTPPPPRPAHTRPAVPVVQLIETR